MSSKTEALYDKRANHYELDMRLAGYFRLLNDALAQISSKSTLPPAPKILDVGCGTGLSTKIVRQYIDNARVTGLDLSGKMLDKYISENQTAFIGDFNDPDSIAPYGPEKLSLQDLKPFSLALSAASISEYGSKEAIQFIYDLLDENGQFIIIGMRNNKLARFTGKFWNYTPSGCDKMTDYCYQAGFSSVTEIPIPLKFPLLRKHKFVILASRNGSPEKAS